MMYKMSKEVSIDLKKPEILILSGVLIFFFILTVKVMVNTPVAFGDEGYHTSLGRYLGTMKDYPQWIPYFGSELEKEGFHTPPMIHLLIGSLTMLFGYQESLVKGLQPFIGVILLGYVVFLLTKKIFGTEVGLMASIIAVALPSFATYAVLMYREMIFVFYFTLFALTLLLAIKTDEKKYWILTSIFAGFSVLGKTPGLVAPLLLGIVFLYRLYQQRPNYMNQVKTFALVFLILILVSGSFILRSLVFYHTPHCGFRIMDISGCKRDTGYVNKFEYAGRTVETGTEANALKIGLTNYFDFAYGNVLFVPLTFFLGFAFLALRKKPEDILLLVTFFVFFIPIVYFSFPGRAEDTARFMLPMGPIIALISASYFNEIYQFIKKYYKYAGLIVFVAIIVLSYKSLTQKLAVMTQVKAFSPLFFDACKWIKENTPKDAQIGGVIWGSATVYNCERPIGGGGADVVLSQNITLSLSLLKWYGSTHIFIQKFSISFADERLTERYPISFVNFLESNPQYFKKVYENGPTLDQCRQAGGCDGAVVYDIDYSGIKLIPPEELLKK